MQYKLCRSSVTNATYKNSFHCRSCNFFKIEEGSEYLNEIALCIGNF